MGLVRSIGGAVAWTGVFSFAPLYGVRLAEADCRTNAVFAGDQDWGLVNEHLHAECSAATSFKLICTRLCRTLVGMQAVALLY